MPQLVLEFLDVFFFVFHTTLVFFILLGWIWDKTARLHLATVVLTASSWFILGLRYGIGYCPFTEWHWQVKTALREYDLPHTYMKYLADAWTGQDFDLLLVEVLTLLGFVMAAALSMYRNWNLRRLYIRNPGGR